MTLSCPETGNPEYFKPTVKVLVLPVPQVTTMNSLTKLKIYSESDSEEEKSTPEMRLPLPGFIENICSEKHTRQEVNEEGKIRNFPHEPGNWATYIYIPVDSAEISSYLNDLLNFFKPLDLKPVEDFHISLTRTVILKHHWIPDFVSSVKSSLNGIRSFRLHLFGLKVYTNEQNTRTFLSLKVNGGEGCLESIVRELSNSFRDYNLQGFYEDPSFHLSLLWVPGNRFSEINKYIDMLPLRLKNFELDEKVSHCICATGNKRFTFNFH